MGLDGGRGEWQGQEPITLGWLLPLACFSYPHLHTGDNSDTIPSLPWALVRPSANTLSTPKSSDTRFLPFSSNLLPTTYNHGLIK